ncbi:hypothetical protein [Paenibacillus sp. FSL H8-0537]|uniref:hypothetical protein n=1 Tax=Paenibacillus sp. FSL H8-0537 TaxID=2921399 RepID=UPI003101A537
MSYDLTVLVPNIQEININDWIKDMEKLNTKIEIHPEFSFKDHNGFLPFKVLVTDCLKDSLNSIYLLSGFELSVHDQVSKISWIDKIMNTKKEINKALIISVSSNDSFEMRLAWYSAAVIANRQNGKIKDHQEGTIIKGKQLIEEAKKIVQKYEESIAVDNWKFREFKEWL